MCEYKRVTITFKITLSLVPNHLARDLKRPKKLRGAVLFYVSTKTDVVFEAILRTNEKSGDELSPTVTCHMVMDQ